MTKHIKNFVDGVRQTLVVAPGATYTLPSRGASHRDVNALRGDARSIASDLHKGVSHSGKQVYKR